MMASADSDASAKMFGGYGDNSLLKSAEKPGQNPFFTSPHNSGMRLSGDRGSG